MKPTMYVANVEEGGFENNPLLDQVQEHAAKENSIVVAVCAKIEAEISDLLEEDKLVFLEDLGMHEPGLDRVIRAAYQLLGLQTYFTAGEKKSELGQFIKATSLLRRPVLFTLTSKEGLSVLKPSVITITSTSKAKMEPKKLVN